jgi:putative nucleotidyltransferase with HDIG domain
MKPTNSDTAHIEDIIDRVNQSNISSIANVVTRIITVINDPEATAKELVEIILTDPPLAANVLRLVNSAYCAPKNKIADIQQAVIFIGFEALKELALNQKVCEIFRRNVQINGYSRSRLWKHSVAVALFSKMIYRREFTERGENAYALGLLHDLGIIIEDQFQNQELIEALNIAKHQKLTLREAEQQVMGYDHASVGMALAENWKLPEEISGGIGYHHAPLDAPGVSRRLCQVLHIANYYCQKDNIGFCDAPLQDEALFTDCCHQLKIEHHALELIMEEVQQQIRQMESEGLL